MRALRCATVVALALVLAMLVTTTFAIEFSNITLTLAGTNSTYNTLELTVSLQPGTFPNENRTAPATITGDCSATFDAVFDPTSHIATIPDITFNLEQPGHVSVQDAQFAFSWFGIITEDVSTSGVKLSPYTPATAAPTPISGGLFAADQQWAELNSGSLVYSGVTSGTQNLAATPLDGPNGATSSGTVTISSPTMNGNVATYTATVIMPMSVAQTTTGSSYTAQFQAAGTLKSSGTFQFDFGPRTVYWNALSGDFSAGSNWDVGFAPRTGDTAAIQNGGESTLATPFPGSPAAVWVGNGAATSGTLTLAAGGSLNCNAMVLGQNAAAGTLVLHGGTLSAPSVVQGTGGNGSLYFDGGTLQATASSNQFLAGLGATYVSTGGATINSNGFNVSINQALGHDPALGANADGGLLKTGNGALILSGTNSYNGGTTVTAGSLVVASNQALLDGSSLTVDAGGTFVFPASAASAPVVPSLAAVPGLTATAVPEPGTLMLLSAAICGAAVHRRVRSWRKK